MLTILTICFFVCLSAELFVRSTRFADYIRYIPDDSFGYCPSPNAAGLMRGRFDWRINAGGLRTDHDDAEVEDAIAVIGDSIVEGGSFVRQDQTLAYLIEDELNRAVYPIAAGGWTLSNEIEFLKKKSNLDKFQILVIVVNSDDLDGVNPWSSEITHPTFTPRSQLYYIVRRAFRPYIYQFFPAESPGEVSDAWKARVRWLQGEGDARLIWVLYPNADELALDVRPCIELREALGRDATIIDLMDQSDWRSDCYADRLHPNAKGRAVLAKVIASVIERSTPAA